MKTQEAFMEEVLKYDHVLREVAYKICGNNHTFVEDMMQDTYMKVLQNRDKYTNGNLKAWLIRILHNRIFSVFRHQQVMKEVELPTENSDSRVMKGSLSSSVTKAIMTDHDWPEKYEMSDEVAKAVNQLTDFQKELLPYVIEGTPYMQIAKELHKPVGTVMSRTYRLRQTLKGKLKEN